MSQLSKASEKKLKLASYYREMFKSEAGKAILDDLAKKCHFNKAPLCDEGAAMYREGQRFMVLHILRQSNQDEMALLTRLIEEENQPE